MNPAVPKQAFFYWSGGPLPWLRAQSALSFLRLHPGWRVYLASPEEIELPAGVLFLRDDVTGPHLSPAARSDTWRWHTLAKMGGIYADTDVIFTRNVESLFQDPADAWMTLDMGTPVTKAGFDEHDYTAWKIRASIGVLASVRGSKFFARLARASLSERVSSDYQSHGTALIASQWSELVADGVTVANIPARLFYAGGSSARQVRVLWEPQTCGAEDLRGMFGVHWYGGSPESAPYCSVRSPEDLPAGSVVRSALIT